MRMDKKPFLFDLSGLCRHEKSAAGLAYLVLICLVFAQVVFFSKSLMPLLFYPHGNTLAGSGSPSTRTPENTYNVDLATPAYYETPIDRFVGLVYRRGELPLWIPYLAAGKPVVAEYSPRALFPYQILQDMAPPVTWDFFILGRLWISGFFTFLFLRRLGASPIGAFLGGVFFMLGGSSMWFVSLQMLSNPSMTIPIVLAASELVLRKQTLAASIPMAVSVGLVLLAGQPESAIYVFALAALFLVVQASVLAGWRRLPGLLVRPGIAAVAGLLLAAPQVLPFLELVPLSFNQHRAGTFNNGAAVIRFPEAIGVIVPSYFTFPTFPREMPVNGYWDELGGYTGVTMMVLAVGGFLVAGRFLVQQALFLAVGLGILAKSFGYPLSYWVGSLPFFEQVWSQRWAGPVWVFSIACAAALGLDALLDRGCRAGARDDLVAWITAQRRTILEWVGGMFLVSALGAFAMDAVGIGEGPTTVTCLWTSPGACHARLWWHAAILGIAIPAMFAWGVSRRTPPELRERWWMARLFVAGLALAGLFQLVGTWIIDSRAALASPGREFQVLGQLAGGLMAILLVAAVLWLGARALRGGQIVPGLVALSVFELWFWVPRGTDIGTSWALFVLFAVGMVSALLLVTRRREIGALVAGLVALSVVAVEASAIRGLPPRRDPFTESAYIRYLRTHAGPHRVFGMHGTLYPNLAAAFGIRDVRYLNSLSVRTYVDYVSNYLRPPGSATWTPLWFPGVQEVQYSGAPIAQHPALWLARCPAAYARLGVKYVITPAALPLRDAFAVYGTAETGPFRLVYRGEVAIWENSSVLPRAFVSNRARVVDSRHAALAAFGPITRDRCPDATDWDMISVEEPVNVPVDTPGEGRSAHSTAEIVGEAPSEVRIDAVLDRAGVLVLADVHYPGWEATADGRLFRVLRVDGLFRGVVLPAGTHHVVFRYRPRSFTLGVELAILTGVALAAASVLEARWASRKR